ncbi:MAG: DUF4388 domain-containing protein [Sandaracinaceae bacterium]
MGIERRRHDRVMSSLEIQVQGLESRARMRQGDLSESGLFVRMNVDVGEPGAVHGLRMRTRDKVIRIEVPARVVRVERADDLLSGRIVTGVAFEFLAYEPGKAEEIGALVGHVAQDAAVRCDDRAEGGSVDTAWQLRKGEQVHIEVPSPTGGKLRFEGRAVRSRKTSTGSFRTRFEMTERPSSEPPQAAVQGIRDAMQTPEESVQAATREAPDFAGELKALSIPSLLSLVTLERMTGTLTVRRPLGEAVLYLRQGGVVDVELLEDPRPPRALLKEICHWPAGRFELRLGPVDRPDRIETNTTALLLQLARLHDEETSGMRPVPKAHVG